MSARVDPSSIARRLAAGEALAALLKDHILIAGQLIADVQSGSANAAATPAAWFANADDIAAALHSINPKNWDIEHMGAMMRVHLDRTLEEAVARLEGRRERRGLDPALVVSGHRLRRAQPEVAQREVDGVVSLGADEDAYAR